MEFGGSHYTALIRVYQAFRKYQTILRCCRGLVTRANRKGKKLIEAHAAAGFWEHIGSAIDNLGQCYEKAPVGHTKKTGPTGKRKPAER